MTSRTWHKGPPPHVGWWNASLMNDSKAWRWWDGRYWSVGAEPSNSQLEALRAAKVPCMGFTFGVEWTDYYPKNARVPRVNPVTGEVTGGAV